MDRSTLVDAHIGKRRSEGRAEPGVERDYRASQPHAVRDIGSVQGPSTAEGHQIEVSVVEPSIDRDLAHRAGHVVVDRRDQCECGLLRPETDLLAKLRERRLRGVELQIHLAAQEELRIEATEDEIRVGHCGLSTACPVTDRGRDPRLRWPARLAGARSRRLRRSSRRRLRCT